MPHILLRFMAIEEENKLKLSRRSASVWVVIAMTDSIINGKLVMKDREVLTLDEEKIMFEADRHMKEIIKRAY